MRAALRSRDARAGGVQRSAELEEINGRIMRIQPAFRRIMARFGRRHSAREAGAHGGVCARAADRRPALATSGAATSRRW